MKKRALAMLLTINLLFTFIAARLFQLSVLPQDVSVQTGTRTKEIGTVRGTVFDRKLTPLVNNGIKYFLCVNPSFSSLTFARELEDEELVAKIQERKFIIEKTEVPQNYKNCNDIKILEGYKRYTDNSLCHVIGYLNGEGDGVSGIEKYYNALLSSYGGTLSVSYSADARGQVLIGEDIYIKDDGYYNTGGISLTIDRDIQLLVEKALYYYNVTKGAAVVLDVNTNEMLACASTPIFDTNNLSEYLNDENSPFINRAFCSYSVGSIFKVVTSAAALENNIPLQSYSCKGYVEIGDTTFNCNNAEGHKEIEFNDAISKSCNPYFVDLGLKTGTENILDLCKAFHLGEATDFGNGFKTETGTLPDKEASLGDGDLANLSFGQGKLTATPLQMATVFSTIANGGYYIEPSLIKGIVERDGNLAEAEIKIKNKILSDETCSTLKNALEMTSVNGTGIAAHSNLFSSCTKTATAQSGQYDKNGNEINICWFVGFFPKENPQYTICILKEQGSSGGSDCGPVFKEIAEGLYLIS